MSRNSIRTGINKNTSTKKVDEVGNYEKASFLHKKAAAAKAFLLKAGLPKQLAKKTQA